jgi:hypothetical protein
MGSIIEKLKSIFKRNKVGPSAKETKTKAMDKLEPNQVDTRTTSSVSTTSRAPTKIVKSTHRGKKRKRSK